LDAFYQEMLSCLSVGSRCDDHIGCDSNFYYRATGIPSVVAHQVAIDSANCYCTVSGQMRNTPLLWGINPINYVFFAAIVHGP
jgi:hypothetical protein